MNRQELIKKHLTGDFLLKGEFFKLDSQREDVIQRAERNAGYTIPTLFPDEDRMDEEMQQDYQSVGSQAVNNLANKIMMALFQPSRPFFRMDLTADQRAELEATGAEPAFIDEALATAERNAMKLMDKTNARVVMHDAVQHLIITGNALLHTPDDGNHVCYSLRDYVNSRDLRGNVVRTIIREVKVVSSLSDELATIAMQHNYQEDDEVTIYTGIMRVDKDRYMVHQELEDVAYCHKAVGMYSKSTLPWLNLVWSLSRGNDYGTSLVELNSGDFALLSTLAQSIRDYTVVMTDVKNLVNPAGQTDVQDLTEAESGAYVYGLEQDIYVHQPQVGAVSDFLAHQFEVTSRRIGAAFLLNSAVTRDAERVTAQEIRLQAQELEASFGGVYSRLANDLQRPLAKRLLKQIDPVFSEVEPIIVTGLESLSRNSELDNIRAFLQDLIILSEVPEQAAMRIDYGGLISVLGAGHGVDYKKFLKDEDVVKQEQQAAMQANAQAAGMEAGAVQQAQGQAQ